MLLCLGLQVNVVSNPSSFVQDIHHLILYKEYVQIIFTLQNFYGSYTKFIEI